MKRLIYLLVPVFVCLNAFAQKDYFIFIQQSSGQPFYVRMGDKSFSSSAGGHLILSRLKDTTYNLYVGFPKSTAPELLFSVMMGSKDKGFELKIMNGVWQLFDLQSARLTTPVQVEPKTEGATGVRKTDTYSELLAGLVDDSAVLYGNAVTPEPVKVADTGKPAVAVVKNTKAVRKRKGQGRPAVHDTVAAKPAGAVPVMAVVDSAAVADSAAAGVAQHETSRVTDPVPAVADTGRHADSIVHIETAGTVADTGENAGTTLPAPVAATGSEIRDAAVKKDTAEGVQSAMPQAVALKDTVLKKDTSQARVHPVPAAAADTTSVAVSDAAPKVPVASKPGIIRYGSENTVEGKLIIYIDRSAPVSDTIRILIPHL